MDNQAKCIEEINCLNQWRRYQSTLSFILYVAIKKLFPESQLRIEHSISHGFYCLLNRKLTDKDLMAIDLKMREIIRANLPIERFSLPRAKAIRLFERYHQKDKVKLLKNVNIEKINIYKFDGFFGIYPNPPFERTGMVDKFYLTNFPPGFIIVFPNWQNLDSLPPYIPQPKLARIFNEYLNWVQILGITDVADLNRAIKNGQGSDIIRVAEALHEKKIVYIADRITSDKKKVVLIAGPSSAGKTTFTKRLAVQLMVNGFRPVLISTDDYFLPHSKTPRDKFGRLDFESIQAVDISLLNKHLLAIIRGEEVRLPKFNFIKRNREKGKIVKLPKNGIVMVEGIHCLNEELTPLIPKNIKFKIYISALTQLNIDDQNRISTTDTRMMRRIVRDTHYRGYTVQGVLTQWGRVRAGEEQNIYPFQEEADEMFNSALIYESAVLKKYCVPLLKKIEKNDPFYYETKRLLDYFALFFDLNDRDVPSNSILREFIGGSSFVY
ncbi:MAG: nucleoside kinase [candidate division WOR-3 bacterium]|nr:nucleoside kinase [candidate division WOR-3 bacterium]